ncbi:hypothetical protein HKO22_05375 [Peptoniphilus sp. AGMB00490]|uniref:Copper amine oxidase N-terminal domain n=1 Tax=Peptoniphilus faecalis TaxID=2731255 RepID=A0A848RIA7_9FIRM|nr:stalk domain-containing protein [Peptoniphilus faecalis]NMW85173.1 hypothetical protein [Peptoniphilus faecalis]
MKKIMGTIVASLILFSSVNVFASAKVSSQSIVLDGKDTGIKGYNIEDNNYFKLRDVAALLDGKDAEFNVSYDEDRSAVMINSKSDYKKVEGDLTPLKDSDSEVKVSKHNVYVNGIRHSFSVYTIDGYNYFKLRELGQTIGFDVNFDEKTNSVIIDSKAIEPKSLVKNQVDIKIVEYATSYEDKELDILKDPILDINVFLKNINNNILATKDSGQINGNVQYVKSENIVEVIPLSTKFNGKFTYKPYIRITQDKKSEVFPYESNFEVAKTLTSRGFDPTSEFKISLGTNISDNFVEYSSFNYK